MTTFLGGACGRDHGPPQDSDRGPHAAPMNTAQPPQSAGAVDSKQYVGWGNDPAVGSGQLQHTVPVFFVWPHVPVVASQTAPGTIVPPKKLHFTCASAGVASKQVAPFGVVVN